jgi:hypothetical protein
VLPADAVPVAMTSPAAAATAPMATPILTSTPTRAGPGPYRLQAAIAALHATAPRAELTDWTRIVQAYDALLALQDSPVIALNRLIAISFRDSPEPALKQLPTLDDALHGYPALAAARADFFRRAGQTPDAAAAYQVALNQANTEAERRYLQRRLTEISPHQGRVVDRVEGVPDLLPASKSSRRRCGRTRPACTALRRLLSC